MSNMHFDNKINKVFIECALWKLEPLVLII